MNRKFIFVLLIAALPFAADAQLNGILNKVKNKTKPLIFCRPYMTIIQVGIGIDMTNGTIQGHTCSR